VKVASWIWLDAGVSSILTAAALVFLAELGDKTQLVALGFGARYRLGPVLVGVALGYGAVNLVSVAIGGLAGAALPTRAVSAVGGVVFLGFAAWTWFADGSDGDSDGESRSDPSSGRARPPSLISVVGSVAMAMFIAELGDKTMIATATLAARGDVVWVWIGATLGELAAGSLGVLVGRALGTRLPERTLQLLSTLLFAGFGVALLVAALR
jgi:putative Ca2+/H+ antiporter (TMEM165/GDT1 family)